jgi:hypothetical protein
MRQKRFMYFCKSLKTDFESLLSSPVQTFALDLFFTAFLLDNSSDFEGIITRLDFIIPQDMYRPIQTFVMALKSQTLRKKDLSRFLQLSELEKQKIKKRFSCHLVLDRAPLDVLKICLRNLENTCKQPSQLSILDTTGLGSSKKKAIIFSTEPLIMAYPKLLSHEDCELLIDKTW